MFNNIYNPWKLFLKYKEARSIGYEYVAICTFLTTYDEIKATIISYIVLQIIFRGL